MTLAGGDSLNRLLRESMESLPELSVEGAKPAEKLRRRKKSQGIDDDDDDDDDDDQPLMMPESQLMPLEPQQVQSGANTPSPDIILPRVPLTLFFLDIVIPN